MVATLQKTNIQLDRPAAEQLIERINHHLESASNHLRTARKLILEFKDLEGWRALGYKNWTDCKLKAFNRAGAQVDREYKAAKLEMVIHPDSEVGQIPERVLREIPAGWHDGAKLVYTFAEKYAADRGIPLTGGVMKQVVEAIGDAVITGATSDDEYEQHPILERLDLDIRGRILELEKRRAAHAAGDHHREYLIKDQALTPAELMQIRLPEQTAQRLSGKQVYVTVWVESEG